MRVTDMRRIRLRKRASAYTMVEIMVVTAIIALLAALAIPNLLRSRVTSNDTATLQLLKALSTALETYAAANDARYPIANDLAELAASDFATSTPPYLSALKLTTPQFGHEILYAGSIGGYQITGNTMSDNLSGSKNYLISTFGVLESEDCTGPDYSPTAP